MTKKTGDGGLSIKQDLFCKYCIESGGNATEAYCKAYGRTNRDYVRRYASRLNKNPFIKERIQELMAEAGLNRIHLSMGILDLANQNENMFVKLSAMNSLMKIVDKLDSQDKTTELINDTTTVPILGSNIKSMVLLLEDTIKKVRSGEINEKTASSIMGLTNILMKIYPIYKRETPREEDKLTPEQQEQIDNMLRKHHKYCCMSDNENNTLPSITSNVAVIY